MVKVRRFASFGYSWDGTRWTKQPRKRWLAIPALPAVMREPVTATVSLSFSQETRAYVGAMVNGALAWFGKGTICTYTVADGMVSMTLPIKVATKRGLLA